jgi:predicted kinase
MTDKTENKLRPNVVVMVGLPASGKSTARAQAVATGIASESYEYSTDDKIDAYAAEVGSTYTAVFTEYAGEAQKQCDAELSEAIKLGKNILWDQTNMSAKKRRKILKRFDNTYRMDCICILPPFNEEQEVELQRRLDGRPDKDIPAFVMASMRKSFQLPSVNEGFNRVIYYDINGNIIDRNVAADLFGDA